MTDREETHQISSTSNRKCHTVFTGGEALHRTRPMGMITDTLRATLRDLAESDARLYRGLATELTAPTPDQIQAAIELLEANGYRVEKR
jgi:hypothetical protein